MDKNTLIQILKTGNFTFSHDEIENIMDEELSKNPDEMDSELVDICIDILDREETKAETTSIPSKKRIKVSRILLAAAILALVLCCALTVSAKYVRNDTADKIVEFCSDHFMIDLRGGETDAKNHSDKDSKLVSELNKRGVADLILPKDLLSDKYKSEIIDVSEDKDYQNIDINFYGKKNDIKCSVSVVKYKSKTAKSITGENDMSSSYENVRRIMVDGMVVLVFIVDSESCLCRGKRCAGVAGCADVRKRDR